MRREPIEATLERAIIDQLRDLHTALPGYIDAYDPENKTATVVIPYSELFETDGVNDANVDYAPIPDVPVLFPRGNGWSITWPLAQGDPVLVIFAERSIDEWCASDGKTLITPAITEMHSDADCIAIPGLFPSKNSRGMADGRNLLISHTSGGVVKIEPNGTMHVVGPRLNVGSESANTALALADRTNTAIGNLQTRIDAIGILLGFPPLGPQLSVSSGRAFTDD